MKTIKFKGKRTDTGDWIYGDLLMKDEPMKQRLLESEHKIGRSFFPPDYIPKYACPNGKYPMVEDVFRYVTDKNATLDMFEPEEGYACMSMFHGLCE